MPRAEREIDWSPEADEDLVDIWVYLARETSPEFADRQLLAIEQASSRLHDWPLSGRDRSEIAAGLRSTVVPPYVVFMSQQTTAFRSSGSPMDGVTFQQYFLNNSGANAPPHGRRPDWLIAP